MMVENAVDLIGVRKIFEDDGVDEKFAAVDGIDLQIKRGEFFTLLGPSGCGKTTTLRLIAGFEIPSEGKVLINGRDTTRIPPYRRPVHTVFQNYALFPHLTVAQNIAYGLKVKRIPKAERMRRVEEVLQLVKLSGLGSRRPDKLSGGQQQRIALARALVNEPAVLLLDEPLGALDLKLRKDMQWELKRLQELTGFTFIYVTHDQEEALTMSDRIAVMSNGKVVQIGTPHQIYTQPSSFFVADFIGESNFLSAEFIGSVQNALVVRIAGLDISIPDSSRNLREGETIMLALRPERISLLPVNEKSHEKCELQGVVNARVFIGTDIRYEVQLQDGQKLRVLSRINGSPTQRDFQVGDTALVCFASKDVIVFGA